MITLVLFLSTIVLVVECLNCERGLWPLPQKVVLYDEISLQISGFQITVQSGSVSTPILQKAIDRYSQLIFINGEINDPWPPATPALTGLVVYVKQQSQLNSTTDEAYTLIISVHKLKFFMYSINFSF